MYTFTFFNITYEVPDNVNVHLREIDCEVEGCEAHHVSFDFYQDGAVIPMDRYDEVGIRKAEAVKYEDLA